ncbi:hypothetical protein [Eubacterium sp.]|uniref:hypothetical protein n=1 Tax=Eubacterium sp. TaxID=142586 RepID=UPI0025D82CD1|nr:hypothetical protein [Eubacterium sp.]MCR5629281.1 hypothetical protein [Eubacterium sp.]
MKKKLAILGLCIGLLSLLSACTLRSNKKISEEKIEARREMFEEYLKEKYPGKSFTVKVWQEHTKKTGAAGLPDYEGYVYRQVVIDSEGKCFMVFPGDNGKCTDDYQKVLDGWIHYNEKGQHVVYDEESNIVDEYY